MCESCCNDGTHTLLLAKLYLAANRIILILLSSPRFVLLKNIYNSSWRRVAIKNKDCE